MIARPAEAFLRFLDARGWVTWEQAEDDALVLTVTNAWPDSQHPTRAVFVRRTVDGLAAAGVRSDVLYVRGYRGPHCYLLACLALTLLPHARPGRYRLIHSHGGETALVARFFRGAPVLASYWGSDLLGPQEGGWRLRLKSTIVSRLLRVHANLMTATTTKSRQMEELLPRRVRHRNWVIPDGVDRSVFKPMDRQTARSVLGWPRDELAIISVGRPVALKRLDLAEHAATRAAEHAGPLRWRSISNLEPADMPALYNAADLLLHTSASEGSPNVVKEALACDLPVVATPAGDIADLLDGVEPSAVCPPDAEILAHAIVACLSEGVRSNGRERTAHLGIEHVTEQTLECYRSLGLTRAVRPRAAV